MSIDYYIPICRQCGKKCDTEWTDKGIGAYEYAGAPGYDSRPCEVSRCCHADFELVPDIKDEGDEDDTH